MSISVGRAASRLAPCLKPFIQTSRTSSRQFSSGPASPLGTRLANSLAAISTTPKYNSQNTINHTIHKSYLGSLVSVIVAGIAAWLFTTLFKTAHAEESVSKAEEAAAIAQKQSEWWECLGRTPDEFGGYIYHYKLRKEFKANYEIVRMNWEILSMNYELEQKEAQGNYAKQTAIAKKYTALFDNLRKALEKSYEESFLFSEPRFFQQIQPIVSIVSERRFKDLGYGVRRDNNETYLDLPDQEALDGRIAKKREKNPAIKQIKIFSSDEELNEMTLAAAYLKYDIVLSPRGRFIHHHIEYVLPTLNLMLSFPEEYAAERTKLRGIIGVVDERINTIEKKLEQDPQNDLKNQLPKIKVILSIAVSHLWSLQTLGRLEELTPSTFEKTGVDTIRSDYSLGQFWEKKFGEKFEESTALEEWKKITADLQEHKIQASDSRINP